MALDEINFKRIQYCRIKSSDLSSLRLSSLTTGMIEEILQTRYIAVQQVQLTQRINSSGSGERFYVRTSGNLQPRIQEHRVHVFRLLDNGHGVLVNTRQERIGSRKATFNRRADHRSVVLVVVFATSVVIVDVDSNATAFDIRAGGLSVGEQDTLCAVDKNHQQDKVNAEYEHRGRRCLKGLSDFNKSTKILTSGWYVLLIKIYRRYYNIMWV